MHRAHTHILTIIISIVCKQINVHLRLFIWILVRSVLGCCQFDVCSVYCLHFVHVFLCALLFCCFFLPCNMKAYKLCTDELREICAKYPKYCEQNGVYAHAQSEHCWALIKILIKMFKSEFRFIQIFRPRLAFVLDLAELWILEVEFEPQLILIDFNRTYQFRLKKNRWTPCKIRTSELSTCVFNRGPL